MTTATQPSAADLDAVAVEAQVRQATAPTPVITPTAFEIDTAIERYEYALLLGKAADRAIADEKAKLTALVESFGQVPAHAGQSKRLAGQHNEATITWSTSYTVIEERVEAFDVYLAAQGYRAIFGRFFSPVTKHKMVEGAHDVLKTLDLPNRIREKVAALVGLAIAVKTSAPSLKVKTIQPEKPARTKRAAKVAA